jgi:hypothetical protein
MVALIVQHPANVQSSRHALSGLDLYNWLMQFHHGESLAFAGGIGALLVNLGCKSI